MRICKIIQAFVKNKSVKDSIAPVVNPKKPLTEVLSSLPDEIKLTRKFGENTKVVYTTKQTPDGIIKSTQVFEPSAGFGWDSPALRISRTAEISQKDGASVFDGKLIEIKKHYHGTMSNYERNINIKKEYLPDGKLEHSVLSTTSRGGNVSKEVYDKSVSPITGKSLYTTTIEKKQAQIAAEEAKIAAKNEAAKKAQEEIDKIAPKINLGKVFSLNFNEFTKMKEVTKPDGMIVRSYKSKSLNGKSCYIITKDRGDYHEEYLVNLEKDLKISLKMQDVNKHSGEIQVKNGWNYRIDTKFNNKNDVDNLYTYNDRENSAQWIGRGDHYGQYRVPEITKEQNKIDSKWSNHEISFDLYLSESKKLADKLETIKKGMLKVHEDKHISPYYLLYPFSE